MQTFWKVIIIIKICKMYGYLPCYYYFVTFIINIFFINLNILNVDVFSPAGNQHHETIIIFLLSLTSKPKTKKVILYHADSLYQ